MGGMLNPRKQSKSSLFLKERQLTVTMSFSSYVDLRTFRYFDQKKQDSD